MDRRRFNKGTKGNKGGRPRKIDFTSKIENACEKMLLDLLDDEQIREEILSSLGKRMTKDKDVKSEHGWIYIVKDGDIAKIGITSNLKSRISTYKSHNPSIEVIYASYVKNPNKIEKRVLEAVETVYGDWYDYEESKTLELINIATKYLIS